MLESKLELARLAENMRDMLRGDQPMIQTHGIGT